MMTMICKFHGIKQRIILTELEITVSFDDGSEKTEKLSLKTGKLEVDYDDNGNMYYTGNVLEDNDNVTPYDYGVYAEIGNMQ